MLSFAVIVCSSFPSGLYQVSVGVGIPSDTHLNVTVLPIQDLVADEVMLSIFAGSVKKILKRTNNKWNRKSQRRWEEGSLNRRWGRLFHLSPIVA